MSGKKIPFDQIAKLADDVRLIQDFSENHNFDSELLSAKVTPANPKKKKLDMPLLAMIVSIIGVIISIAIIIFWPATLSQPVKSFIFLLGLVFVTVSSMAAHMRFHEIVVTTIVAVGLLMVLFIGAGIFTPKEAMDTVREFKN